MKAVRRPSALVVVKLAQRSLLPDLRQLILTAREQVARAIDGRLAQLYWEIGRRIRQDILREKRAGYGEKIVATLSRQLGWSHFKEIIPVEDPPARDFYAELCRVEQWSVRTLRQKIQSMLFERTALSKKPTKLIERELARLRRSNQLSPDLVFRDPYVLDFLGLKNTYADRDLEAAILREMESFLLELGVGFAFVARQNRMTIGGRDHHLDLLF